MKNKKRWVKALTESVNVWIDKAGGKTDNKPCPLCDEAHKDSKKVDWMERLGVCAYCAIHTATGDDCMSQWREWLTKDRDKKVATEIAFRLSSLREAIIQGVL